MADTPKPLPTKQAAIIAVIAALFVAAVAYYPPLLPVCQALNFCPATPVIDTVQPVPNPQ